MNECNQKFLDKLNFTDFDSAKIYREKEINPLVSGWQVTNYLGFINVFVGDILGSDFFPGQYDNIPQALDKYFKDGNDNTKILKLNNDKIISRIKNGLKTNPICVKEIDDGKYVVTNDGITRYMILKLLYLSEMQKAITDDEKQVIKQKYTILVNAEKVDLDISYTMYLMGIIFSGKIKDIMTDYDEHYHKNGGVRIRFNDGTEKAYTRKNFLKLIMSIDCQANYMDIFDEANESIIEKMVKAYDKLDSFKRFISNYCPCLYDVIVENKKYLENKIINKPSKQYKKISFY